MNDRKYQQLSRGFEEYYRALAAEQQAQATEQQAQLAPDVRIHYSSRSSMVDVPLHQALITGLLSGLVIAGTVFLAARELGDLRPHVAALTWAGIGAPVITLLAWLGLSASARRLVWMLETAFVQDLDGDSRIGEPWTETEPPRETVRVEIAEDDGRRQQFVDLPVGVEKMIRLSRSLVAGSTFSESQWTGAGALFSRSEFHALRDEMLRRGWIVWKNPSAPAQGLAPTRTGWAVIKYFAEMSPTPGGSGAQTIH